MWVYCQHSGKCNRTETQSAACMGQANPKSIHASEAPSDAAVANELLAIECVLIVGGKLLTRLQTQMACFACTAPRESEGGVGA